MYGIPAAALTMTPFDAPFQPDAVRITGKTHAPTLIDPFGRAIDYVRVSVTDRCDLRCVYCMPERMRSCPGREVLTLEELERVGTVFIGLGARKLRLTGGEPLVRKGVMGWSKGWSRHLRSGALDELTLTTNGARLADSPTDLARAGRAAGQRLDGHARRRPVPPAHARRRPRASAPGRGGCHGARACDVKINVVALSARQSGGDPGHGPVGARPGPRPDPDRDHADGRGRRGPHRPVPVAARACASELAAIWTLTPDAHAPAVRRAMCGWRRPAGGSASSRRSATPSATPATGCA